MKYVVFTTKHHDGFCMFDTRLTDFRITAPEVPFHTNARSNVAREVFKARPSTKHGPLRLTRTGQWSSPGNVNTHMRFIWHRSQAMACPTT
jgi:hypothetical protein